MKRKKDASPNSEALYSAENLPPRNLVESWLLDHSIFSDADIRSFLFIDVFAKTISPNMPRAAMVQKILQVTLEQDTYPLLCERIFLRRPYLQNNERPEFFDPQLKLELHRTFTAALCYFGEKYHLDFILEEFNILTEDYFPTNGLFHEFVWECITELERGRHMSSPHVQRMLKQMGEIKKRLRRRPREKTLIVPKKLPLTATPPQEEVIRRRLAQLDEAGFQRVIQTYNFMAIPYPYQPTDRRTELVTQFAQQTQTTNRLVAALHHHYPNLDLTVFDLERRVRSALNISTIRGFSTREIVDRAQSYPIELPYPQRLVTLLQREKKFTRHKAARLAQILGYQVDRTRTKHEVITNMVAAAQAKSEMRVLIHGVLALYRDVKVPSVQELTAHRKNK